MVDLRAIGGIVGGLLLVAVRSFVCTLLGLLALGVILAACSYFILAQRHPVYGVLAALVALLGCLAVGVVLGAKRAPVMALVHGLRKHRLGALSVRLIFERLLGVHAEQAFGERGGVVARAVERLPLAQAEKRLDEAVTELLDAPAQGGGLAGRIRRRLQNILLRAVRKYTLARFREEDAQHGGIDLVRVQAEMGERIDGLLIGKLKRGINLWTGLILVGLPVQVIALDYVVLALLK
jgi:hypothetical protein